MKLRNFILLLGFIGVSTILSACGCHGIECCGSDASECCDSSATGRYKNTNDQHNNSHSHGDDGEEQRGSKDAF